MIDTSIIKALSKPWGTSFDIFNNANFEIRHNCAKLGGYSSCHYHHNKNNLIYVVSGVLLVHFYSSEDKECSKIAHTVTLERGNKLIIPPKVWHRFYGSEASEEVNFIEAYWLAPVDVEDTISKDVGGRDQF
jgi:mannose-6-phosphate isomerase-like protein (cupin superfamily)